MAAVLGFRQNRRLNRHHRSVDRLGPGVKAPPPAHGLVRPGVDPDGLRMLDREHLKLARPDGRSIVLLVDRDRLDLHDGARLARPNPLRPC